MPRACYGAASLNSAQHKFANGWACFCTIELVQSTVYRTVSALHAQNMQKSATDREVVLGLLEEHRARRDGGDEKCDTSAELYRLGAIGQTFNSDGTIPVLMPLPDLQSKLVVASDAQFRECGFAAESGSLRWLEGFSLMQGGKGFVIAGGAVSNVLIGEDEDTNDVDLFLIGLTSEEEVLDHTHRLAEYLEGNLPEGVRLIVFRTERTITFVCSVTDRYPPIQVILKRYNSIAELLYDFDLGSAATAYDGNSVWMTNLGRFALENGLNVLDLSCRRPSYEYRIEKYFERGFGLILPNLNPAALQGVQVLQFSGLQVEIKTANPLGLSAVAWRVVASSSAEERNSWYGMHQAYEDETQMLIKNCSLLRSPDSTTGGLCGRARYRSGMNFTAIAVDFRKLETYIRAHATADSSTEVRDLFAVLGGNLGRAFSGEDAAVVAAAVRAELEPRSVIPFRVLGDGEGLLATPTTASEWYGDHHLPIDRE